MGELILAAIRMGARRIVLAVGGVATTDGGAGLLEALGARLTDAPGNPSPRFLLDHLPAEKAIIAGRHKCGQFVVRDAIMT